MGQAQIAPPADVVTHREGPAKEGLGREPASFPFRDNVAGLLDNIRTMARKSGGLFAIVFSFEPLSHIERLPGIISDFCKSRDKLKSFAGGDLVQVGETDFVLLSDQSEFGVVGAVTDIKMMLLKVIARHAPDAFTGLDQARLVRVLDLSRQRAELFKLLEETLRRTASERSSKSRRPMSSVDLELILDKVDSLSRQDFIDQFARCQPLAILRANQSPAVALNEWFVSMAVLQQKFLPGGNLQLNRPLFNMLTLELDQRMLDCLLRKHIDPRFATFNFNVETIFTRKFEELGKTDIARQLIVELRASDVFEDFDRFLLAKKHITDLGARIAIDNVGPAMVTVLKADRLGCDFVKIFVDDLHTASPLFAETVREMHEGGTHVIFARIESLESVRAGMMLGVDLYQGFYIDTLLKSEEERARFLVA